MSTLLGIHRITDTKCENTTGQYEIILKEGSKENHIIDHRGQRRPMSQHLKSRWEPEDRTWLMVVLPYYPAIPPPRPQTLSGQKSNDFFTTSIVSDRMAIAVDDLWSSH